MYMNNCTVLYGYILLSHRDYCYTCRFSPIVIIIKWVINYNASEILYNDVLVIYGLYSYKCIPMI